MNDSSFDNQLNKVLLKPRFVFQHQDSKAIIIKKFQESFKAETFNFRGKVVGDYVVIDVAKEDEHFWSPQLQIEIENNEDSTSTIKGLFGPKPQVWTFFMFIHFAVALAFFVFATMLYSRWSLDQDYTIPLIICIVLPILWVVLYFSGQLGKKKGYQQMIVLDNYVMQMLEN